MKRPFCTADAHFVVFRKPPKANRCTVSNCEPRAFAAANARGSNFETVHLFAFGGFLKTTKWASAVQNGRFTVNDKDGDFEVKL